MQTEHRNAFTLVEMLVVLAVIGIMAALLVPVFAQARAKSRQTACISNLRQLATSITMYAADYDDRLPMALDMNTAASYVANPSDVPPEDLGLPTIKAVLAPYKAIDAVFHCPQDHLSDEVSEAMNHKASWFDYCGASYKYEEELALSGQALSSVRRPSDTLLFFDYQAFHDGMVSSAFADGHAKAHTYADWWLKVCYTDPTQAGCENAQD
jgi:prepilin-type N-terminal cleavage/methylation domain-containing protein